MNYISYQDPYMEKLENYDQYRFNATEQPLSLQLDDESFGRHVDGQMRMPEPADDYTVGRGLVDEMYG